MERVHGSRHLLVSLYGLFFIAELGQSMLVPLVPVFAREFALTEIGTGAILSAATLTTVAVAVPAGLAADRFGALRVSVAAGLVLAAAALVQGFAGDFATLLAGRVVFGVAFATIWTAGIALLTTESRAGAVAGAVTVGGLAHLVGPPVSGYLTELVGRSVPFFVLATAGLVVSALLALARAPRERSTGSPGLRTAARAVRRQRVLRSAVIVMAFIGTFTGLVPLVVPLLLDERGYSSGDIGAVFAAGSIAWVTMSALAVRTGERAVTVRMAAGGLVLLGVATLVPSATLVAPCLIAFVLLRACVQAPLSTINYVLGGNGARAAGLASGTAIGLLNVVWGICAGAAPLLGGAVMQMFGARPVFGVLAVACLLGGAALGLSPRWPNLRRPWRSPAQPAYQRI